MERKTLTLRLPPKVYNALSTLSSVTHRSMNDLVTEAVGKLAASESEVRARDLEETLRRLRACRELDPEFKQASAKFIEAEVKYDDPLEGEPFEVKGPVRDKVHSLLTDG